MDQSAPSHQHPTFAEAFRFWLKLGFISFGGPTGQIAIMHQELVEKRGWISEHRFLHALNYCMLLPGPEAQQLAIYIGWLLHRTWGGIVAGVLFVLPSAFILWGLSWLYIAGQGVGWVAAAFYGLKSAVLAIVLSAVLRIGLKVLKNEVMWGIAALAFVGIFFLKAPFPLIIALAALAGWIGGKMRRDKFLVIKGHAGSALPASAHGDAAATRETHTRSSLGRVLRVSLTCLALWWVPVLLLGGWLGWNSTHVKQGIFFSEAAVITFGGAYAVLPYVAQQAVEKYDWLSTPQMMDGLGLAETTPGPLIMVLQFVGFVGGWNHPVPGWSPLLSATLSAAVTTWVTFVPCFLWILLGAPYIERLRGNERLTCALSAVTAAVVGVVLNLAVWFAWYALFPQASSRAAAPHSWQPDWFVLVVAVAAFIGLQKWKWNVVPVVLVAALLGLIWNVAR